MRAAFTRVAIFEDDHLRGSDLDLYAFRSDGTYVDAAPDTSAVEGSTGHIDLPPGDHDVYLVRSGGQRDALLGMNHPVPWTRGYG